MKDAGFCPLIRELDNNTKFFIWDFDIVCAFFTGLSIGIFFGHLGIGAILGVLLAKGFAHLKQGRHPGLGIHLLYWYLPFHPFKRLPASHRREFHG